jgi:hypothetical protein
MGAVPPQYAGLEERPWRDPAFEVPQAVHDIVGMLSWYERRMLTWLGSHWSGRGAILDLGAFLGGSALGFATGLVQQGVEERAIHSYDRFHLGPFERQAYFAAGEPPGGLTRALFDTNLEGYERLLSVREGDILGIPWDGGSIEILFVDIAKEYRVFDYLLESYFPALVPGESLVILQDYYWESGPWHHVVMELLAPYVVPVADEPCSALFALVEPIPTDLLASLRWRRIPAPTKRAAMERALTRIEPGEWRDNVLGAQRLLLGEAF